MDNTFGHVTTNFASKVSKHLIKIVDAGGHYPTVAPFQFDVCGGVSSSYFSSLTGSKRKRKVADGSADLHDGSLVPGFGCSSSSCITISSGKEIEEDASMNLGPSIDLNLSIDWRTEEMNIPCDTPMTLISERPKVDLELSLSTGASGSAITSVTQRYIQVQDSVPAPLIDGIVQHVDEGSISSRWNRGPLVPSFQITDATTLLGLFTSHDNPRPAITGFSSSATTAQRSSFACASGLIPQQQRRNSSVKTCQFSGCIKAARGASGFCIGHGGGRRCQRGGCDKGAEGKTVFCKAHGGGRRCQFLGCTKSTEGRTDYCIGHGGGRRCSHDDCLRAARGKSGLCIRHGGGKRCKMENCSKSAEGITGLCISHGGGRRCRFPNCTKGAQGSTMLCKAHGGGKRCTFLGCLKGAEGSTPFCKGHGGGKRCTFEGGCTKSVHGGTLYCVNHGGGKRCAVTGCTKSARGPTNFCVRHGGGKRCKHEGCDKSAQGSTDFCKGHGGGKRCSWGQSDFGGQPVTPCDKLARGKSGLCASHSYQVHDMQTPAQSTVYPAMQDLQACTSEKMKGVYAFGNSHADVIPIMGSGGISIDSTGHAQKWIPMQISPLDICLEENALLPQFTLPEGRVHGGSLMAMLRGSSTVGPSNNDQKVCASLELGTSYSMPRNWV